MQQATMNKSLLIIKASQGGLGAVEGFLRNRDWKIKTTTNLKEALIYLVQEHPQFVMVAIDHPNRKIRNLPKILAQAFPVCVIAFSEQSSAASYNLLSTCASEYLLYPPVTGPAVERTVNKYYKDQQTRGLDPHREHGSFSSSEEGTISIKGGLQNAQSILAHMLGEDSSSFGVVTADKSQDPGMARQGLGAGTSLNPLLDQEDSRPLSSHYHRSEKQGSPGWQPVKKEERKNKERPGPEQPDEETSLTKKDSIILRGTKEALENSCTLGSETAAPQAIEQSSNIACIVIESSRFSGYLITAMGKNKTLDSAFMQKIRERLYRFLRENGEEVKEGDTLDLKIKEVPFEDWALDYAEFLKKSIHEGNEVAMAFFPRTDIKASYGESSAEEMASIKIEELAENVSVEFNVYIHLPRNNKYVLYTPRGGVFYGTQKERLLNQGVSKLHILKEDLKDLDKYRAQNFLNDKVEEFEAKERSKEPA